MPYLINGLLNPVTIRTIFLIFIFSDGNYYSMTMVPSQPMVPTIDVPKLIRQSSEEAGWDSPMAAGGMLTHSQASKVLCGLSQEVDRYMFHEDTCLSQFYLI